MTVSDVFEAALRKLGEHIEDLADIDNERSQFVRDICQQWKTNGGKTGGKPRHSDRYLNDYLQSQGTPVRSLTPKLTGKTNIQPRDGSVLVRVFLSHWPVPGEEEGAVEYKPFLSDKEIDAIANRVGEQLDSGVSSEENIPVREPSPHAMPGEDTGELLTRLFEESDALITVSPARTFIPAQPNTELIGFRNLINAFKATELRDKRARPLIWIFDLGDQTFEDVASRRKYLDVQSGIARFKALRHFADRDSEQRWKWLQKRVIIILLDPVASSDEEKEKTDTGHRQIVRPPFQASNITLDDVPSDWLHTTGFRTLYGRNLEEFDLRSFTVFYNASEDWLSPTEWSETSDIRYFGYASFTSVKGEIVSRGIELPPLPLRSTQGFRAAVAAGAHALGLDIVVDPELSGEKATEQLSHLGFRALKLDKFLAEY